MSFLNELFSEPGSYVVFDGQFGSTGKGLLLSYLAEHVEPFDVVTTNQGPNSGHTALVDGEPVVLKQLPMFPVICQKLHRKVPVTYLNGGAVINPGILKEELIRHGMYATVHGDAAVVKDKHKGDQHSDIASTGQGVGPAMQAKLERREDAVYGGYVGRHDYGEIGRMDLNHPNWRVLVEVAQGWSLGINSGFYPYVTSRECSVAQGLADAQLAPKGLQFSIASLRTFPIRVGHTEDGNSGPVYIDQEELEWEELGQPPETTTVTGRVRRVFTWSNMQYFEMLRANRPDGLFFNFINYLPIGQQRDWVDEKIELYTWAMGQPPKLVLLGRGPSNDDVEMYE